MSSFYKYSLNLKDPLGNYLRTFCFEDLDLELLKELLIVA